MNYESFVISVIYSNRFHSDFIQNIPCIPFGLSSDIFNIHSSEILLKCSQIKKKGWDAISTRLHNVKQMSVNFTIAFDYCIWDSRAF